MVFDQIPILIGMKEVRLYINMIFYENKYLQYPLRDILT